MEPTTRKASSIDEEEERILETSNQEETPKDKEKKEKKEEEKIKPEEDKLIERTRETARPSTKDQGKGIIQTKTRPIPNDPVCRAAMKEVEDDFNAYAKHFFL